MLHALVGQGRQGRGTAVGDAEDLRASIPKPLRHLHRATGVAADAEGQQHILGLHPQKLVGGVDGSGAQLLHAGAAHVQVQGQPGGHGGAVDLRQHKDAPLALRDARDDGLECRHVQPVARGGDVVLVVQQGVVHTLLQAAFGADGDGRALPRRLQQRRDFGTGLALGFGIAGEVGEMHVAVAVGEQGIKDRLENHPGIRSVSMSSRVPSGRLLDSQGTTAEVNGELTQIDVRIADIHVGHNFLETYGIPVVAGRTFDFLQTSDSTEAFVLNETAIRAVGWSSAEMRLESSFNMAEGEALSPE